MIQQTSLYADLVNMLLGDSYTYKAIIGNKSLQVSNSSKEQNLNLFLYQGSDVDASLRSSSVELSYPSPDPKRKVAILVKKFSRLATSTPSSSELKMSGQKNSQDEDKTETKESHSDVEDTIEDPSELLSEKKTNIREMLGLCLMKSRIYIQYWMILILNIRR